MNDYFEYNIKNGDTLSSIIHKMFGYTSRDSRYQTTIEYLQSLNPHLIDPNKIRYGDTLRLGVIPANKPAINIITRPAVNTIKQSPKSTHSNPPLITTAIPPQDNDAFWALSLFEQNTNYLTIPGGIALGANGNLMALQILA